VQQDYPILGEAMPSDSQNPQAMNEIL